MAGWIPWQWAIGDWLVDGKKHYGDKLYERAAAITGAEEKTLRNFKSIAATVELSRRRDKLSWAHHAEAASLKTIAEDEKGGRQNVVQHIDPGQQVVETSGVLSETGKN